VSRLIEKNAVNPAKATKITAINSILVIERPLFAIFAP
jgi:hypothetical protein